jgi:hypothetical protein
VLNGTNSVAVEELRKGALHDAAIGKHVAHAGGHAQVVFEDYELAGVEPEKIGPDHGDVDVAGDLQSAHLAAIVLATIDQLTGNDVIVEDLRLGIDVAQKKVEGGDALGEAALDVIPFLSCDQAG